MKRTRWTTIILLFSVFVITCFTKLPAIAVEDCNNGIITSFTEYDSLSAIVITPPEGFVYALVDGYNEPHQFIEIKAGIRSAIAGTPLGSGTLRAQARYVRRTDYVTDLSTGAPKKNFLENTLSFSESAPIEVDSLGNETATEFTFDFSAEPIPAGIVDLWFYVFYKGADQPGILEGKKDLNEPMHLVVINSTDRFYLDGVLRTGDEIRQDQALKDRVDFDGDGEINEYWQDGDEKEPYVDPFNITVGLIFGDDTPQSWTTYYTDLVPGTYGRLIFLTQGDTFNVKFKSVAVWPDEIIEADYLLTGVKDHWTKIDGSNDRLFEVTGLINIRDAIAHQHFFRVNVYPSSSGIFPNSWPELTFVPVSF